MENSDKQLIYIKVPEEYALAAKIPGFDSSIPLPLLLTDEGKDFRPETLSEEMILAGMLNVFAYERDNQHIAYYRDIFKERRPNILEEMTNAAILKIKNADFDLAEQLLFALEGLFPEHNQTKLNVALLMDERHGSYSVGHCAVKNGGRTLQRHSYTVWNSEKRLLRNWQLPIAIFAMNLPSV